MSDYEEHQHRDWWLVKTVTPVTGWTRWVAWKEKVQHAAFPTRSEAAEYADRFDSVLCEHDTGRNEQAA